MSAARIASAFVLFLAAAALPSVAAAQAVVYHHRSTVFGDYAAGAAELVHAQAAYLRAEADAARQWVDVAAARDQLYYQRAEANYRLKQMKLEYVQQIAANNRQRQQLDAAAEEAAARRLVQSVQRGLPMWPAVLKQPEYAASMGLIESLLKAWAPNDAANDVYRRALATEAGVLRARIVNNHSIDYINRSKACETLDRLQLLAGMSVETAAGGSQLALQ